MQFDPSKLLKEIADRQLQLASLIIIAWLFRFLACSQLKYLNEDDIAAAVFTLFSSILVYGCVQIVQLHASGKATKSVAAAYVLFTFVINVVGVLCVFETFVLFLHMFACESIAFKHMEWTPNGIRGEIQKCPWMIFDRSNCRVNEWCPFTNRSVELIVRGHWRRQMGVSASLFTLMVLAVLITVFCGACIDLTKILCRFLGACCASEESSSTPIRNQPGDSSPPPSYPGTASVKQLEERDQDLISISL